MELTGVSSVGKIFDNQEISSDKITDKKDLSVQKAADSFADLFQKTISDVQELEDNSKQLTQALALDKTTDLHKVMIAGEKASIALQFMVKVRNKAIDAYQEVMRMQV